MDKETLLVSPSNRNLERKIRLFGFEIFDLLILSGCLSLFNIAFKGIPYQMPLVWGVTGLCALLIFFTKRNKPENYLLYKVRYWFSPAVFYATGFDLKMIPYLEREHVQN